MTTRSNQQKRKSRKQQVQIPNRQELVFGTPLSQKRKVPLLVESAILY